MGYRVIPAKPMYQCDHCGIEAEGDGTSGLPVGWMRDRGKPLFFCSTQCKDYHLWHVNHPVSVEGALLLFSVWSTVLDRYFGQCDGW